MYEATRSEGDSAAQGARAIVDVLHPDHFGHPVAISGTIDAATADQVLRGLLYASLPGETLLVDLSRVEGIDEAGLAALGAARRQARRIGGDLIIAGLPDEFDTLLVDFTTDDDLRRL